MIEQVKVYEILVCVGNYLWLHHFKKNFSLVLIFGHLVLLLASFDELNLIINYDELLGMSLESGMQQQIYWGQE